MLEQEDELEIPESAEELSEEQALQLMEQFTQELEEQEESYAHTAKLKKNIFWHEYRLVLKEKFVMKMYFE